MDQKANLTPEQARQAREARRDQLEILKAMGTIMAHVSDEDILERWLPWGIEPGMEPEDLEVLLPDFPAIVSHFARLVRMATGKGAGGPDGWLFVLGPRGENLAGSAVSAVSADSADSGEPRGKSRDSGESGKIAEKLKTPLDFQVRMR